MFVVDRVDGVAARAAAPIQVPPSPTSSLRAAGLAEAIDALLAADPDGLTDGELATVMVDLRREHARLAAVVAEMTAAFDARQVHAEEGSRSAADWIAVRCRIPRPRAGREVREGRRLRAMPFTRAALRAGNINPAHVRVLCGLAGHPRAAAHFPDGEPGLVDHAQQLRFDDWQQVVDHWLAGADPDGPEHKRQRDHDLRRFRIPTGLGGVGHPDGYLTPLATETINEALARIDRELFETDWATAREVHGDATTVADLARTPAQRRHDALVEMAVRATTAPAHGKRPAPLVTVMVDLPTLAGRVCQLAGTGTVIAPGDIVELLGHDDTLIERVVGDGTNRVRDISTARNFRGTLRRILEITHPRCDHPTCFVPAKDCQGDHVVPWSYGGPTSQHNGRMGCPFHNRLWYHRPHLRPPQRRLDLHPPGHDPPDDDTPSDDPRADTPTGDLEHDPPDGLAAADAPPVVLTPARTNIVDRSRDHLSCRRSAPPRAPDLVATIDEAIYAIRLAA